MTQNHGAIPTGCVQLQLKLRGVGAALQEQPEHRGNPRCFLIWSLMTGVIPPVRVVERILAEIEREWVSESSTHAFGSFSSCAHVRDGRDQGGEQFGEWEAAR